MTVTLADLADLSLDLAKVLPDRLSLLGLNCLIVEDVFDVEAEITKQGYLLILQNSEFGV